jgi:Family of unknown function (DUF6222)
MTEPQARLSPEPATAPASDYSTTVPMPRLGRGFCWTDVLAEIERDKEAWIRDAKVS